MSRVELTSEFLPSSIIAQRAGMSPVIESSLIFGKSKNRNTVHLIPSLEDQHNCYLPSCLWIADRDQLKSPAGIFFVILEICKADPLIIADEVAARKPHRKVSFRRVSWLLSLVEDQVSVRRQLPDSFSREQKLRFSICRTPRAKLSQKSLESPAYSHPQT